MYIFFDGPIYTSTLINSHSILSRILKYILNDQPCAFNSIFVYLSIKKYLLAVFFINLFLIHLTVGCASNLYQDTKELNISQYSSLPKILQVNNFEENRINLFPIINDISHDMWIDIVSYLNLQENCQLESVCKLWKLRHNHPRIWKNVGHIINADNWIENITKEVLKTHWIRMIVNLQDNPQRIFELISKYKVLSYFKEKSVFWRKDLTYSYRTITKIFPYFAVEILAIQINENAVEKQIFMLLKNVRQGTQNPNSIKDFIESAIKLGSKQAIESKIYGLSKGRYGYELAPLEAYKMNESLVAQNDQRAILCKQSGLYLGEFGYKIDLNEARLLNEVRILQGDKKAITNKFFGLSEGKNGYKKSQKDLNAFIEKLVKDGNEQGVAWKVTGLRCGVYGYEESLQGVKEFNESLIQQNNIKSIFRKVKGLANGDYGYEESLSNAQILNEILVAQNNQNAILWKIESLEDGINGYEKDVVEAERLNDLMIRQGHEKFFNRKILGSIFTRKVPEGTHMKEFIENQTNLCTPYTFLAMYYKALGLKFGVWGYDKNVERAQDYILKHCIPF